MKSDILHFAWTEDLSSQSPDSKTHVFSRPGFFEALSLLPVAYRVASYLYDERRNGREPIFDLNGIGLEPPNPGPFGGVPLGGIGGGCIGRGYRGDFRRWSLHPGKYVHRTVHSNQFSIRVQRGSQVFSKVLSIFDGTESLDMSTWSWSVPLSSVTYHALFPRSWTVISSAVPLINVIIKQISPVIPHNYSDTSLPIAVFEIEVENLGEDAEVSILFSFQNGDGGVSDLQGHMAHHTFLISCAKECNDTNLKPNMNVEGIIMAHHHYTHSTPSPSVSTMTSNPPPSPSVSPLLSCKSSFCGISNNNNTTTTTNNTQEKRRKYCDQGSFSIASYIDDMINAHTVVKSITTSTEDHTKKSNASTDILSTDILSLCPM